MLQALHRLTLAATAGLLALAAGTALAQDPPAEGSAAPDFRLQDQAGKWHTLADYRGKWVVMYFYPKDNTPGCTTQACEIRDDIFAFRKLGAVVLGVSVDDVESHKAFAEEYNLPFALLADADKKVAGRYGVLTKFGGIWEIARRDTFIIDPEGRIARHYMKVDPDGHSAMVLAELKKLGAGAGGSGAD